MTLPNRLGLDSQRLEERSHRPGRRSPNNLTEPQRVVCLDLMASITVFQTAELIDQILSCVDEQTLARSARVCKLWSEPALDALWRGLVFANTFLKVLHPQVCAILFKHSHRFVT